MKYLDNYLKQLNNEEIKQSVKTTVDNIVPNYIETFSFNKNFRRISFCDK